MDSLARASDMKLFHLEDIGPHYARTLRHWRERFMARQSEVRAQGYPESFVRMWEYYLCYCEGGFEERQLGDVQMLLTKPRARRASIATVNAAARLSGARSPSSKRSSVPADGSARRTTCPPSPSISAAFTEVRRRWC